MIVHDWPNYVVRQHQPISSPCLLSSSYSSSIGPGVYDFETDGDAFWILKKHEGQLRFKTCWVRSSLPGLVFLRRRFRRQRSRHKYLLKPGCYFLLADSLLLCGFQGASFEEDSHRGYGIFWLGAVEGEVFELLVEALGVVLLLLEWGVWTLMLSLFIYEQENLRNGP